MASEDLTPSNGNGDEASNRTFMIAVGVMGLLLVVGIVVIVAALSSRNGRAPALDQQALDATATAAAVAQITPTDTQEPTATSEPAPTLEPSDTPTVPPPTEAPTATTAATEGATPGGTASAAQATTPAATTSAPPAARTATAAAQAGVPAAQQTPSASGTPAAGSGQIPNTGIGDMAGLVLAGGLIALLFVARRLRTAQT